MTEYHPLPHAQKEWEYVYRLTWLDPVTDEPGRSFTRRLTESGAQNWIRTAQWNIEHAKERGFPAPKILIERAPVGEFETWYFANGQSSIEPSTKVKLPKG